MAYKPHYYPDNISVAKKRRKYIPNYLEKLHNIFDEDSTANFGAIELDSEYLFSWDEIPGNDNDKLIKFLKQEFRIDWVKTEAIEKIDNGNTIKVNTEINHLSLNLNQEKTEVIFKVKDVMTGKFIAKMENGKVNIYSLNQPITHSPLVNLDNLLSDQPITYSPFVNLDNLPLNQPITLLPLIDQYNLLLNQPSIVGLNKCPHCGYDYSFDYSFDVIDKGIAFKCPNCKKWITRNSGIVNKYEPVDEAIPQTPYKHSLSRLMTMNIR